MLSVKNKSRCVFEVNLHPGVDYGFVHESAFTMEQSVTTADGSPGVVVYERALPGSLMWTPSETKDALPDALLLIQEFRAARDAGILLVVQTG